ncbi:hypothetical protein [Gluconacetobacter johannae]|uniref:hypothetical protein n=1 Tax=Gluconacetobacter johannae TaxID=112140 RepID=UPI00222F73BD|nr:hypothetical protein [Gluconacetobacter johannae]
MGVRFCPRGLTGVRNPLFLGYVKAHAARVPEDESFFDLFTLQRHMHANDAGHILVLGRDGAAPRTRPAVQLYAEACAQLSVCQSSFGRSEFETIVNDLVFKIARTAFARAMSIADMIAEGGMADMSLHVADTIRQRARTFVATCVDPCRQPELDTLLDRTTACRPRRCS